MLIGLTGKKQSGKNTAAQFIFDNFGTRYYVVEHSFAGKLKQSAVAAIIGKVVSEEDAIECCEKLKKDSVITIQMPIDDVPGNPYYNWQKLTGREYLQWYGTEAHREIFSENFWTDLILDKMVNPITEVGTARDWESRIDLITDVRFPDEVKAVQSKAGRIMRINRPGLEEGDTHASEQHIPDELIDYEVWNDGTLEEFERKIVTATRYILDKWL